MMFLTTIGQLNYYNFGMPNNGSTCKALDFKVTSVLQKSDIRWQS